MNIGAIYELREPLSTETEPCPWDRVEVSGWYEAMEGQWLAVLTPINGFASPQAVLETDLIELGYEMISPGQEAPVWADLSMADTLRNR